MVKLICFVLGLAVISVVVAADKNVKLMPLRRLFKRNDSSNSNGDEFPSGSSFSLDEPLQDEPRQRPSYNTPAEYEEELRRRQELRRKHEEERQRLIEERRRLENERRRHQEDRQRQENERRRQEEERLRQNELERRHQQESLAAARQGFGQNVTSRHPSDNSRRQQLPSQTHHVHQDLTSHNTFNQDTRTSHPRGQQQVHSSQQPSGIDGGFNQTYQPFRHSGYSSGSRIPSPQHSVYRTNHSSDHASSVVNPTSQFIYHQGQHVIPSQRQSATQQASTPLQRPGYGYLHGQQSGQVDSRSVVGSPRGAGPSYWTRYEYAGQGNWYPSQDAGASYYPFNEQEVYSTCPDTGMELRINGLDCQQALEQYGTSLCYSQEYTSKLCCEVCRPRKQPSRTGCEYGDHSPQCSTITSADCYDVRNRQICCETCDKLRKRDAAAGCEYGDMSIRCDAVRLNPGLCYRPENQRICCETCSQSRNLSNPGCPWGNFDQNLCQMFDDHTHNVRVNCYSHQKRRLCCQTCERLKDWLPYGLPDDCQYGDRPVIFTTSHYGRLNCSTILNYFSVDECTTNPAVYVNCCYTCHRHQQGRG